MVRLQLSFFLICLSSSAVIRPNSNQLRALRTLRRSMNVEILSKNAKAVFNRDYCRTTQLKFEDFFCGQDENAYVTKAYEACRRKYRKRLAEQLPFWEKLRDVAVNLITILLPKWCNEERNAEISDAFVALFSTSQWPAELKKVVDPEAAWPESLKFSGTHLSSAQCSFGVAELMLCNNRTVEYGIMVKFLNMRGNRHFSNIPQFMLIGKDGRVRSLKGCARTPQTGQTFLCNRFLTT